jgi:hypothetical protein
MADPDAEVEAVREALRGLIRQNDRGFAWIDRKLNWSEATASQLLRGRIKLQMMHVFQILQLFKVEPEDFFGNLYGKPVEATRRMMARRESAKAPQERQDSPEAKKEPANN